MHFLRVVGGAAVVAGRCNTVVAPPRTLIAFLENNLKADGTIAIPEPLRMYMGGKSVIE